MRPQQAETEDRPPEPDPFRQLHLLSTAPQDLVVEVYWHLVQRLQQGALETPELRSELDRLNDAYSRIQRPHADSTSDGPDEQQIEASGAVSTKKSWLPFRSSKQSQRKQSPWGLLHLDPGAPPDVVDLAYLFWRLRVRSQWRGTAAANLDELQGAYEALREESSPHMPDEAAASAAPMLETAKPAAIDGGEEIVVDAAEDAGGDAAGTAIGEAAAVLGTEHLNEVELAPPQERGLPLFGSLGRWARRRFGMNGAPAPVSEPADEPPAAAVPSPDMEDQEESWPLAWGAEELDELAEAPEEPVSGHAVAVVQDEMEPAIPEDSVGLDEPPATSAAEIPVEYRIGSQVDHAVAEVQPVPESSDALAYLVGDGGSVRDVRAVIGSQPFAIGSDRSCGLKVAGLGANGGAIAARIWAHDERVMLHVLAKEPAVLVNGQAMVWAVLEDGDRLQIGDDAFRFERAAISGRR